MDEEICFEAFQHICRTCLAYAHLYPINEIEMEDGKLNKILLCFELLEFSNEEIKMPQNMCKSCILEVYKMYRFIKVCQKTQKILKHTLLSSSEKETDINIINAADIKHRENADGHIEKQTNDAAAGELGSFEDESIETIWSCDDRSLSVIENNCCKTEEVMEVSTDIAENTTVSVATDNIEVTTYNPDIKIQNNNVAVDSAEAEALIDKIKQIKSEITSIQTLPSVHKVTSRFKRKVPNNSSSRVSTINRIRIEGPPFNCSECKESFDVYILLRKHWQMYNHHPKNFKCTYCLVAFKSNSVLQQHIRTHTGEKPNICNICNRSFNHRSNFRRHMYTHSDSKRYKCNDCEQGFNRLEFLRDHQRKYHSGEKLLCPYCGKEFTCQGTLKLHEKQHVCHKSEVVIDANIPYQCKTCGKILASEEILNQHMQVHVKKKSQKKTKKTGDTKYKERKDPVCQHCQSIFKNSYELRLHRLDSSCSQFVSRFDCSQCDKFFITYGALYSHLKLHKEASQNNVYECETCHEQFYKERRYKDHVKRHTRERRYICQDCGQGFYVRLHLDNHMRTHTGERPFTCEICQKAFALKVNLTVHMRIHTNVKPYKCSICGHDFRDVSSLRKHSKKYHNVDITYDVKSESII